MKGESEAIVVYWDTSAVLSSLFTDNHSTMGFVYSRIEGGILLMCEGGKEEHSAG